MVPINALFSTADRWWCWDVAVVTMIMKLWMKGVPSCPIWRPVSPRDHYETKSNYERLTKIAIIIIVNSELSGTMTNIKWAKGTRKILRRDYASKKAKLQQRKKAKNGHTLSRTLASQSIAEIASTEALEEQQERHLPSTSPTLREKEVSHRCMRAHRRP